MRRRLPLLPVLLAAAVLAGCDAGERYDRLAGKLADALGEGGGLPDRAAIAALPFAQIGVGPDGGSLGVMTLETVAPDGAQIWTSSDLIKLVMRRGRVVQTAGLDGDLRATLPLEPDPIATGRTDFTDGTRLSRTLDLDSDLGYRTVTLDCTLSWGEDERIEIAGLAYATRVADEDCAAREVAWSFRNRFWIEPGSGFVWQSVQHVRRDQDPFRIVVLKPAG